MSVFATLSCADSHINDQENDQYFPSIQLKLHKQTNKKAPQVKVTLIQDSWVSWEQ